VRQTIVARLQLNGRDTRARPRASRSQRVRRRLEILLRELVRGGPSVEEIDVGV
jgi:hypothetical protein